MRFHLPASYVYLDYSTYNGCLTAKSREHFSRFISCRNNYYTVLIKKHKLLCDNQECLILDEDSKEKKSTERELPLTKIELMPLHSLPVWSGGLGVGSATQLAPSAILALAAGFTIIIYSINNSNIHKPLTPS